MNADLPPLEAMLEDLSKVPGLESFWGMLGMVAQTGILSPRELSIVQKMTGEGDDSNTTSSNTTA